MPAVAQRKPLPPRVLFGEPVGRRAFRTTRLVSAVPAGLVLLFCGVDAALVGPAENLNSVRGGVLVAGDFAGDFALEASFLTVLKEKVGVLLAAATGFAGFAGFAGLPPAFLAVVAADAHPKVNIGLLLTDGSLGLPLPAFVAVVVVTDALPKVKPAKPGGLLTDGSLLSLLVPVPRLPFWVGAVVGVAPNLKLNVGSPPAVFLVSLSVLATAVGLTVLLLLPLLLSFFADAAGLPGPKTIFEAEAGILPPATSVIWPRGPGRPPCAARAGASRGSTCCRCA